MFTQLKFDKNGRAKLFFKNGYGISVINSIGSYSSKSNKTYEVAVLIGNKDKRDLCYSTHITDDVIGRQSIKEIEDLMDKIRNL